MKIGKVSKAEIHKNVKPTKLTLISPIEILRTENIQTVRIPKSFILNS